MQSFRFSRPSQRDGLKDEALRAPNSEIGGLRSSRQRRDTMPAFDLKTRSKTHPLVWIQRLTYVSR
ncbi:MAG: hypothetical protein A2606_03420 [Candidatus Yanofskybacteria bacterium RIFOXYD1_FULL_42_10]|uniref:Uncharacterized protein n=1 Tax=Candidatus Yanofskybacteria bacterium RIFOXYD1_FULL_42_10 TaxID=1802718 RepID=A0A1F8HTB8_9BACT|nr:MAG: hypothetical protein A2606_03420 [Candidatus Yanofskybacteria bacterium RIFOXYD1_FULL_42_10]